jgi:hypothetical protein
LCAHHKIKYLRRRAASRKFSCPHYVRNPIDPCIGRPLGLHKKKVPTRALNTVGTKGGGSSILIKLWLFRRKLWLFRRANPSFEGRLRGL